MAISTEYFDNMNHLVLQKLNFDKETGQREADRLVESLTNKQNNIFQHVMNAMIQPTNGFFFVYGFGGTVRNFLWNALVASNGIATTLLPSSRTTIQDLQFQLMSMKTLCAVYN